MALWKARSLTPEQKVQIVEEESEGRAIDTEESGSFLGIEDAKMSEVFSSVIPVDVSLLFLSCYTVHVTAFYVCIDHNDLQRVTLLHLQIKSLMELFDGGSAERRIMEKVGCVDYSITPWESVKADIYQRQVQYKLMRYGGMVTTTQQKSSLPDDKGWVIEEVMTLQGIPLGDYYDV